MKLAIGLKNWLLILIIVLLVLIAYHPSLDGEFVYDDNRQIEANQLIQNSSLYQQALLSDVWAFKADGSTSVSNYWRPTFVAWMIFNYQMAELDPFYWHVTNISLHILVAVLLFFLLRCWSLSIGMALSTAALFALHPIHVESVAWIAGSPDILFTLFIICALICWHFVVQAHQLKSRHLVLVVFSLLFYALALGAKEVGILFPPLFMLLAYWKGQIAMTTQQTTLKPSTNFKLITISSLFILVAVTYFLIRLKILGFISKGYIESLPINHFLYTLPQVISFYWQQLIIPIEAAANFPPRALSSISIGQFVLPLIFGATMAILVFLLSRKSRIQTLGLLLLLLPLLPALNLFAFHHEQLVHHRYLYLPVLGLLLLIIPTWQRSIGKNYPKANYLVLTLLLTGYTYQSWRFSQIWHDNLSLWQNTLKVDPDSAFNWQQLANAHLGLEQFPEAIAAFDQSINIQATPRSLYGLAKSQHLSGAHDIAARTLQLTINEYRTKIDAYLGYQIYELYAVILTTNNQLPAAENQLRKAISELPQYKALLTDKLVVVLYLQNKKATALKFLTDAQSAALTTTHIAAKMIFFRMGMLYSESNQVDLAKTAFETFLSETQSNSDPTYISYQQLAQKYIDSH